MGKHEADDGLKYVRELSINYETTYDNAHRTMVKKLGQEMTDAFEKSFDERAEHNQSERAEIKFYDFKNETLNGSLVVSGVFDSSFYRNMCNWFSKHRDLFAEDKTILDVGCDCGILTCFVARCCPDAEVTGIDRSANAVARARELAEKLGVTNVRFEQVALKNVKETYDTVICTRVTQENVREPINNIFDTFYNLSEPYRKVLTKFLTELTTPVAEEGKLILGDMIGFDPMFYGEIRTLVGLQCTPVSGKTISYKQFEENHSMSLVICQKTEGVSLDEVVYNEEKPNVQDEKAPLIRPYLKTKEDFYARNFFVGMFHDRDMSVGEFYDWSANIMLEDTAKDLIEGYRIYDAARPYPFLISLWTNANDPTAIIYFGPNSDGTRQYWRNMDLSMKDDTLDVIRGSIHRDYLTGRKITRLSFDGEKLREERISINDVPEAKIPPEMQGSGFQELNSADWRKH